MSETLDIRVCQMNKVNPSFINDKADVERSDMSGVPPSALLGDREESMC